MSNDQLIVADNKRRYGTKLTGAERANLYFCGGTNNWFMWALVPIRVKVGTFIYGGGSNTFFPLAAHYDPNTPIMFAGVSVGSNFEILAFSTVTNTISYQSTARQYFPQVILTNATTGYVYVKLTRHIGTDAIAVFNAVDLSYVTDVIIGNGGADTVNEMVFGVGGIKIYTANRNSRTVSVVGSGGLTVIDTWSFTGTTNSVNCVACLGGGDIVVLANTFTGLGDVIYRCDPSTGTISDTISVTDAFASAYGFAAYQNTVFISYREAKRIRFVDMVSSTITHIITVETAPLSLYVSPDGTTLYAGDVNTSDPWITIIDIATATITGYIKNIGGASRPAGMALTSI